MQSRIFLAALATVWAFSTTAEAQRAPARGAKPAPARPAARPATPKPAAPVVPPAPPVKSWDEMTTDELRSMSDLVTISALEHGLYLTTNETRLIDTLRVAASLEEVRPMLVPLFASVARQLYAGRLVPTEVGSDIRFSKKTLTDEKLRQMVIDAAGSYQKLEGVLVPQMIEYRTLVRLMDRLKQLQAQGAWAPLGNFKKPLRLNSVDPVVGRIKTRLAALGYTITNMDDKFDTETQQAVGDIQRVLKMNPDFIVSPGGSTIRYLETSLEARLAQVRADLEKLRWLPQDPKSRYIFVNLAFSSLLLMDYNEANPVVFNFKTINGRFERKTPSMVDKIYQVILNPFWTIPPTVFLKDKVEALQGLGPWEIQEFFDRNHYYVVSENFRTQYDPTTIDWHNITSSRVGFFIRQRPNYSNALGVVKFSLTNGEAIYLHDTGERELFNQSNRLLSSGCVRVEKPIDLAEYVLRGTQWNRFAIENHVARPGEVLSKETPIEIKNTIPVYMLPVTSHYASDGVMRFTADVYGHNQSINDQVQFRVF